MGGLLNNRRPPLMIKPYNRALGANGKHANRASPEEMHPYPRLRRYFSQRGKSSPRLASELISTSRHSAAKISPSGGDAAAGGRRGAFPSPEGRLYGFPTSGASLACFPTGVSPVVRFYQHTSTLAHYTGFLQTGAFNELKGAHHHPLNPVNLLSRVDGIRLLCPPLTEPYLQFSRIRLLE